MSGFGLHDGGGCFHFESANNDGASAVPEQTESDLAVVIAAPPEEAGAAVATPDVVANPEAPTAVVDGTEAPVTPTDLTASPAPIATVALNGVDTSVSGTLTLNNAGADTIGVSKHGEVLTVVGFGDGDVLVITDPASPREVHETQTADGVLLELGGLGGQAADHSTVILQGVTLADLHAGVDATGLLQISYAGSDLSPIA